MARRSICISIWSDTEHTSTRARLVFTFQIKSQIPAISLTCCPGIKQNHLERQCFPPPQGAPQDTSGASQTGSEHGGLHRGVRVYPPWSTSQVFSGQGVSAQVLGFCKSYNCACAHGQALGTAIKVKGWLRESRWRGKHKKYSRFLKAEHQLMRRSGLSAVGDIAVPLLPKVKATLWVQPPAPHRHRAPHPGYGQMAGTLQPCPYGQKGQSPPGKNPL